MSVGRRRLVVPPEAEDFSTGAHFVNAIQREAADQALVAALNMAGQSTSRQGGFRMNVLATFGLVSSSFGQWWRAEGGEHVACHRPPPGSSPQADIASSRAWSAPGRR
jgi:hypothetical protein